MVNFILEQDCMNHLSRRKLGIEGENMAMVECKIFLAEVKELKKEISEVVFENQELEEKLKNSIIALLDVYIERLEQMEPGTIVEVV